MKYDVIAYCWNDALAGFTREDARRLTHVNLAFGLIKDGLLDLHLLKYLHPVSYTHLTLPTNSLV